MFRGQRPKWRGDIPGANLVLLEPAEVYPTGGRHTRLWDDERTVKRLIRYGIPVLIVALFAIGIAGIHSQKAPKPTKLTLSQMQAQLRGSPAKLAALHAAGGQLLPTSKHAFKEQLTKLKGTPVVVNKWASWCGPCRFEFPYLQRTSTQFGKQVAFVGLNSGDVDKDARDFLHRFPVPYPSYIDPNDHVAFSVGMSSGAPITEYYDAAGKLTHTHEGVYASRADLASDIRRYALAQ
jgi:cytochrome c biogenesis protein CcmG/thiol:disulfide interchange protein DsbE